MDNTPSVWPVDVVNPVAEFLTYVILPPVQTPVGPVTGLNCVTVWPSVKGKTVESKYNTQPVIFSINEKLPV